MPKATHRPPATAPQVYSNTFRAGTHQPFMPATLVTKNTNVYTRRTIWGQDFRNGLLTSVVIVICRTYTIFQVH
jgi:hypothetical protein